MKALQYIEIDIDYCALTYGVAPCTAAIGVTGNIKCFNSPKTCQDRANFSLDPVTLRFAVASSYLPLDIEAIPSIKSIGFDPSKISLGKDLGERASLTIVFYDHPHSDTGAGFDKYLADRTYNPYLQGSFWGKFRARHPYLFGRPLRWINGILGQSLSEMETRNFVIDSFSGPTASGEYTLVAKDPLKLADGDKAQAPRANKGYLVAGIDAAVTSATLSPAGIGNTEYPASGKCNIGGKEICSFTRSGDVLTLTRAQAGTAASSHSAQDLVQVVLEYSADDAADILYDLLVTYAEVSAGYINLTTWKTETASYLNRVYTSLIANPTSVKDLMSELAEQAGLSLWWNDRTQKIGLLVLRGAITDPTALNEDNIFTSSIQITEQPDKRLSQIQVYFGQINPLTSLTDVSNYRSVSISKDTQAETDYGSAAIKQIFSRWIPALGRSVADRLGVILLGRFRDPPRHFKFNLFRFAQSEIQLAHSYAVSTKALQDATGAAVDVTAQVTRLKPGPDLIGIEADEVLFVAPDEDLTIRRIIVDSNINNINLRTAHDSLYPAAQNGDTVELTINAGVIVGSSNTANPALNIGTWPAGVTVNVIIKGRIEGRGGLGGNNNNTVGLPGGDALYTRKAINLDVVAGQIWSGGGGGGGSGGGCGGGGGGGQQPGLGGIGAAGLSNGADGTTELGGAGGGGFGSDGGDGGNPGYPGGTGQERASVPGGVGGAAGKAVDGISYVTITAGPGDIRGAQVN